GRFGATSLIKKGIDPALRELSGRDVVIAPPLDLGRLAEALLDLDTQDAGQFPAPVRHPLANPARDVVGQELGRGVGDRHQRTLLAWEAPVAIAVGDAQVRALLM